MTEWSDGDGRGRGDRKMRPTTSRAQSINMKATVYLHALVIRLPLHRSNAFIRARKKNREEATGGSEGLVGRAGEGKLTRTVRGAGRRDWAERWAWGLSESECNAKVVILQQKTRDWGRGLIYIAADL